MFKYAKPVFLKGKDKEKNVTGFFAANFEWQENEVTLEICASSVYRVTVNGDTVCDSKLEKVMDVFCYESIDITRYVTEGLNQIVIECCGYYNEIGGERQKNFVMAEISNNNNSLAATGYNFIGFLDAERISNTEITESGDYREKYNVTGAAMIKMNVDVVDFGHMKFKGMFTKYNYSYKNAVKAIEKGKFTPYLKTELRYPLELEEGEYCIYDMEEVMKGFIRVAFKTYDKAKIRVSYSKEKDSCDGFVDFDVIDGEFDRENFLRTDLRFIKVDVIKGKAEIHLAGVHKIE